ncbi:flagellar biosynthetic protein FliO [Effusibacillus lacus]|uniref:Flagellar protein n=1 Tax=Effusibacillus lacus TaxID=1348429 RepID=A0A292YMX4_9BACL|nr:flagellar biosynthetic protein FliO [Effusibacillus lacus]TCS73131.1 flagellar protein FliO/FliZ [Effusibacillus lacus]GAX90536.1 hypothetical protein EFBL_2163 [Effusibacillus lacus]
MTFLALGESVEDLIKRGGQGSGTQSPPISGAGSGWSLFFGILEMIVILAVIAGVIYLLIRFLALKTHSTRMHPLMQTIVVHPLSTNRSIQLIALEDRVYVVGVGEDITLIDVIVDEELIGRIKDKSPAFTSPELSGWLSKWLPVQRKPEVEEDIQASPFYETLQSKLQQVKEQRKKIQEWDSDNQ